MRALAIVALVAGGCTFDPGPVGTGGGLDDGGIEDAHVPDGDVDLSAAGPDLHLVPDGIAPGTPGWPCDSAGECANGFCIDGYCCENACDRDASTCMACNVPGQEGQCVFVLDGTDPRQQCDQDPISTCGRDGLCDGQGKCRKWNAGTACGSTTCSNGTVTYAPACDGLGTCVAGEVASCYPYACLNVASCATSCSNALMTCASGVPCTNGTCGKRSDGQPCSGAGDCQSDHCEQGVCCASACTGTCFACNLAGTTGTCAAVPSGLDPLNQCTAAPRGTCGLDGSCDGSGACRKWKAGTTCAPSGCTGSTSLKARTCDGLGTCQVAAIQKCDPYTCNPQIGACFTTCKTSLECAMGKKCNTGKGECH